MILVLDNFTDTDSHGEIICKIIKNHTNVKIRKINLSNNISNIKLYDKLKRLGYIVKNKDVLLITWATNPDPTLDLLINNIANNCSVIVSAGNFNQNIKNFSPTRSSNVTVVGCLNKSLLKASHSNYSDIDMKWIVGTSYIIEDQVQNGTSVSAAIYSAFLANCIEKNDPSFLEQQINQYHNSVKI